MLMEKVEIEKVKQNQNNPRVIRDEKFKQLVKSIKSFPKMLELRPIVVDENFIVLGGNMRLKACKEAQLKEVWVTKVDDLTDKEKEEFIIKDNLGYGEWDWDLIKSDWDLELVSDWGLDLPIFLQKKDFQLGEFFEEGSAEESDDVKKKIIKLEYTDDEYSLVKKELSKVNKNLEKAIWSLLDMDKKIANVSEGSSNN